MDVDTLTDRVSSRLDEANERLAPRVEALREDAGAQLDVLRDDLGAQWRDLRDRAAETVATEQLHRPRWSTRLLWLGLGAVAGMVAAYFADPERGRARRTYTAERVSATGRDLAGSVTQKADYVAGEAKGAVVETAKTATPEDVPSDPKVLRQRIRSEVFGERDDVEGVVIRIDGPGQVALKGTIPTPDAERSLVAQVSKVEGVTDVQSELATSTG